MVQGKGRSSVVITSPHNTQFFICIKEKKTTHVLDKIRYTPEDMETEAASIADQPVKKEEGVVFGDIWSKRERTYLCRVEEGVQRHWSFGRIVLVGDAAHKMTPVGAHGGNCGIESAAGLANALHKHLRLHPDHPIDDTTIQQAFAAYQRKREPRVRNFYGRVYKATRLLSYDNWILWFVARYVMPLMNSDKMLTGLFEDAESVDALAQPLRARRFKDLVPAKTEMRQSEGLFQTVVGLGNTVVSVMSRVLQGTMAMLDTTVKSKQQ
ncbi:MAG: hypothetical protein OHK93_004897 [Ramalina farinacea]|uniref:FAD-binding domain-containing protein n=1 Tax=Ramalina farinacea TaxID=258253 RepID=A0AA43U0R4_9LECA|nr:hypothetical protein [Ramalina farinacea]